MKKPSFEGRDLKVKETDTPGLFRAIESGGTIDGSIPHTEDNMVCMSSQPDWAQEFLEAAPIILSWLSLEARRRSE